ncbi:MAG: ammonium transporter [Hyphomonadaceae bacterium]
MKILGKHGQGKAVWAALRIGVVALAAAFALGVAVSAPAIAQDAAPAAAVTTAPAPAEAVTTAATPEAAPVAAEAAPAAEAAAAEPADTMDKGDTAWMMTATALVLMMCVPALGLFYGGLVRAKNMLSVLMQVSTCVAIGLVVWALWGYSLAFGTGFGDTPLSPFLGGMNQFFMAGINADSTAATFTDHVVIPELVFMSFQATFAAITAALVLGSVVERMKFSAVVIFSIIWPILSYYPIAHMVWASGGLLFDMGAYDFAGGTVVHINAGISGLMGALILGPRLGYRTEQMPPHSLVMTLIGAGLLWVGWFGFNAGSNLEATGGAGLAFTNTLMATAAAGLSWALVEWITKGKPSMLGFASGLVAGLVAITPACGFAGPMGGIILGAVVSPICIFFCTGVKNLLKYDDSLDVFGIHCVGGIVGALGTAIVANGAFGGINGDDYNMMHQLGVQGTAVGTSLVWSAVAGIIVFGILKFIPGMRVSKETEQEGLDIAEHGERAYHV